MKQKLQGFICGVLITLLASGAVYAATTIKSAEFNSNKVYFDGEEIDLSAQPMVSVTKSGEVDPRNYMPMRAVFEEMGYGVAWNYGDVLVMSREYLEESEDWVNYARVEQIIELVDLQNAFYYEHERRGTHYYFDSMHHWEIPTAVVGDDVYVLKESIDHIFDLKGMPKCDKFTDEYIAQIKEQIPTIVHIWAVMDALRLQDDPENELWIDYDEEQKCIIVLYEGEAIGFLAEVDCKWSGKAMYMSRAQINAFLVEYGLGEI